MLSVCETAACRRVLLLKHFGEESEPCGHCDNCLHPPVRFDGTVLVQKLLSCVYRAGQRFAAGYITNLCAVKATIDTRQPARTTVYLRHRCGVVRQRMAQRHPPVHQPRLPHRQHCPISGIATDRSRQKVLKGETEVMLRPLKRGKPAARTLKDNWLRTEREERLWQALRVWRMKQAEAEAHPRLYDFRRQNPARPCRKMPQNLNGLHDIYGLGEAKTERFGHGILEVCRNAADFSRDAVIRPQTEREQQLRQKLEAWRYEQARAENCALHAVLSDESLADMLADTPETETDLEARTRLGQRTRRQIRTGHPRRLPSVFRRHR